MTTNKMVK